MLVADSDNSLGDLRSCLLGLPGAAADLGNEEINAERGVLVVQEALELRDLFAEHVWSVTNAADHADAAGVRDSRCQLGAGGDVHAGEHDRVCDPEEVGGHRADLLYSASACYHPRI